MLEQELENSVVCPRQPLQELLDLQQPHVSVRHHGDVLEVSHVFLVTSHYMLYPPSLCLLSAHLGQERRQPLEEEVLHGGGHGVDGDVESVYTEAGVLVKLLEDEIHVGPAVVVIIVRR